jgi:hypothetical protein
MASRRALSMKTIRQSQLIRAWSRRSRVGDIVIYDVLGAAPRGSGATEAALGKMCAVQQKISKRRMRTLMVRVFLIVPG